MVRLILSIITMSIIIVIIIISISISPLTYYPSV